MMNLWLVRLARSEKENDHKHREALALEDNTLMIGYNISADVRSMNDVELRSHIEAVNPESDYIQKKQKQNKGKKDKKYNYKSHITSVFKRIKDFKDNISAGDYVISPFMDDDNDKIRVGKFVGQIEMLGNLLAGDPQKLQELQSLHQANPHMLARKVDWLYELPCRNKMHSDIQKECKARKSVAPITYSGNLPDCIAPNISQFTIP